MEADAIAGVVLKIATSTPTDDDTHLGGDGLLYCNRCYTARQSRITLLGTVQTVNCLCYCMAEERDRQERERRERERTEAIMRNRAGAFPDKELAGFTFENDSGNAPEITRAMKAYVEHFPEFQKRGKGLLLYGDVGTGKTFFAACVVNALIDKGYPCLMTNFSRILYAIEATRNGKQAFIDGLAQYALVAIDDLGVERDSKYMNEAATTVIDSLYRAGVPMLITSNYTPRELIEASEINKKRIFDRMLERCHPIMVNGSSVRKDRGRRDFQEMKKLLGL